MFILYRENEIFKDYNADHFEDHVLSKDLLNFLASAEPRVIDLVEKEIMNDGQKISIVIKMILERISLSPSDVYDDKDKIISKKTVPTVKYHTVWRRGATVPVINKNDTHEMYDKANGKIVGKLDYEWEILSAKYPADSHSECTTKYNNALRRAQL